jgi:excinuclease ABC subunit B
MKQAIDETNRRRKIQKAFNKKNNIMPTTIKKDIMPVFGSVYGAEDISTDKVAEAVAAYESLDNIDDIIKSLEGEMAQAAKELEFERAGELRDQIKELKRIALY